MDEHERPRKRRRRREAARPIAAKLILDDRSKGEVGCVSRDLYARLFGAAIEDSQNDIQFIALTPWRNIIRGLEETLNWTVLAIKSEDSSHNATNQIRFSASALSLQNLAKAFEGTRLDSRVKDGVEILVLDAVPINLETIFVRLDGDALRKHEEVQKRFGGGFLASEGAGRPKLKSRTSSTRSLSSEDERFSDKSLNVEERLKDAVKASLKQIPIVHTNDLLPLPIPSHPITHVPFPPVQIILSEPVSQGQIALTTEIVIEVDFKNSNVKYKTSTFSRSSGSRRFSAMISTEDEGDTTDQFYSAAENDEDEEAETVTKQEDTSSTETSDSDESLSDDSEDNIISLNSPTLPPQASGILSAWTAATPRPFDFRKNGNISPGAGSVYSNHTTRTISQQTSTGRSFSVRALAARVPDDMLHPRPPTDEDDEARVYVDMKVLVRLGCFSGDWVKISATPIPGHGDQLFSVGEFGDYETIESFRPVKIYGVSGIGTNDASQYSRNLHPRRSSISSVINSMRPSPQAFLSPVLLLNLGTPSKISVAPLMGRQQSEKKFSISKVSAAAIPFIATDLTLFRLLTPIASLRTTSAGIFTNLKQYFEGRRRIVKEGDLVAIKFAPAISSILSDGGVNLEVEEELQDLLLASEIDNDCAKDKTEVAWFKVSRTSEKYADDLNSGIDSDIWGGAVCAEPLSTKIQQAGSECIKLPSTQQSPWAYYYGIKQIPTRSTLKISSIFTQDDLPRPYVSNLQRQLRDLLAASTSPQASRLGTQPLSLLMYSTQRRIGKSYMVSSACNDLGLSAYIIDSYEILSEGSGGGDSKTEEALRSKIDFAVSCGSNLTIPIILHIEALTAERMATAINDALKQVRAIVFTTTEREKIPESIRSLFTHELEVSVPDEKEREGILRSILVERNVKVSYDVEVSTVALKTAALVAGDLVDVIERAVIAKKERLEALVSNQLDCFLRDVILAGGNGARSVTKADFDIAVEAARKNFADAIGAPKIPNVTWDDVGGLTHVKDAVMETIQLPLERPELFTKGMKKRSGILFYGPPGTGKTLLAKAIATEFSLNFFSVKGPELLNMYIGESEANVRRVFQKARDARPCVVFFDELDSVAPKRGNQGDSGGVMDRIVSQLLAELDGMSDGKGGGGGVFVIGATNRPDLLDQALLRPGRFDKMLYLGVSDTHDKQLTILEALTRKFALDDKLSLRRVAESLPFTYTGADLYALCSDAMLKAITRKASAVDDKIKRLAGGPVTTSQFFDHYATDEDIDVVVTERDFEAAQRELISSVRSVSMKIYQYQSFQISNVHTAPKNLSTINESEQHSSHHLLHLHQQLHIQMEQ